MAFHDAYEHHEKEAIHGKLIQSDAVSEHNLSVTTSLNKELYRASSASVRCGTST